MHKHKSTKTQTQTEEKIENRKRKRGQEEKGTYVNSEIEKEQKGKNIMGKERIGKSQQM